MRNVYVILIGITTLVLISATAVAGEEMFQGFRIVNVIVNGQPLQSDVPAVNFFGRTVLPLRTVAEVAGMDVQWDSFTNTATLTSQGSKVETSLRAENAKLKAELSTALTNLDATNLSLVSTRADLVAANMEITRLQPPVVAPPTKGVTIGPKISVEGYKVRVDIIGGTHVYAVIKNIGDEAAEDPTVSMTATSNGQLLATGKGDLGGAAILIPGQRASVEIWASGSIPDGSQIEWSTSSDQVTRKIPDLRLVTSAMTRDSDGEAHAIGTLRNEGLVPVKFVKVVATFLNNNGEVVHSEDGYAAISDLDPGKLTSFDVHSPYLKLTDAASVEIYLTGHAD